MKKLSGGLGKNNIDCLPMEHKISKKKTDSLYLQSQKYQKSYDKETQGKLYRKKLEKEKVPITSVDSTLHFMDY